MTAAAPRGGVLALGIAAVVIVAFVPALGGGFLRWDDHYNFAANPHYRGLGRAQLAWMFTSAWSGHWAPLTWLTLSLDWVLWAPNALGFHLTSVLLHAANAAVLFAVASRLLARAVPDAGPASLRAGAVVAALVFAIHPLRAESVAWISERRDVVSGLFYLLTVLAYLRACASDGAPRRRWLALSVAVYVLAMMSKAIVMTLPVVLLVLDVYPLRRLQWGTLRQRLVEKIPFALVAALGAGVAVMVATELKTAASYPLWARPAVFGYNLVFYLWKSLVPAGLSPLYELPARWEPTDARLVAGLIVPVLITVALVACRRRWPAGLAAWTAYVVTLMPVAGLAVHTGPQIAADRYTYLACLGVALLLGGAVCLVARADAIAPALRRLAAAAGIVALAGLGTLTWQQSAVWHDDVTLWRHATVVDPTCGGCFNHLGVSLHSVGASAAAVEPLRRAIALRGDTPDFHGDLGIVLLWLDRAPDAVPHLERVTAAYPDNLFLQTYLGSALARTGRYADAHARLTVVLSARPNDVDALTAMGFALAGAGRPREAVAYFERASVRAPRAVPPRVGLAQAWRALGDDARAERELAELRSLQTRLAEQARRR